MPPNKFPHGRRTKCEYVFASMVIMAEKSARFSAGWRFLLFVCEQPKSICSAKWNSRLREIVPMINFVARAFKWALPVKLHLIIVASRCYYCLGMAHTIYPHVNHVVSAPTCCKADCLMKPLNDICSTCIFLCLSKMISVVDISSWDAYLWTTISVTRIFILFTYRHCKHFLIIKSWWMCTLLIKKIDKRKRYSHASIRWFYLRIISISIDFRSDDGNLWEIGNESMQI